MAAAAAADVACSSFFKLSTHFLKSLNSSSSSSSISTVRFPSLHLVPASYFSVPLAVSHCRRPLPALPLLSFTRAKRDVAISVAVAGDEENSALTTALEEMVEDGRVPHEVKFPARRPCELYVCNLPRSCGISQLLDLFQPYGSVFSVEVSRDAETGLSRGCGYVVLGSVQEAKAAIAALDGSDLGGREMCVKFSADMNSGRKNIGVLNTAPKKSIVFETPHKVYVGNLAWTVRPDNLREYFNQFATVVSTRLICDRKGGRVRAYAFLSFNSPDEVNAATERNGSVFHGRKLVVREAIERENLISTVVSFS
ncbi:29 kDa ribonucleoprotein A, chloroplastic isoform X1 [Canna indica]|uniref:29 kDa ribonucleoprotein A, chloroplastic isoform X1 n=1 Tax=Canna indica TaxID=4628 RepID=A0AAQ3PYI6_9LILI|nr:29 kDa ribonucleoprotein A, chloroplastic isoform X1 [Canna indica]